MILQYLTLPGTCLTGPLLPVQNPTAPKKPEEPIGRQIVTLRYLTEGGEGGAGCLSSDNPIPKYAIAIPAVPVVKPHQLRGAGRTSRPICWWLVRADKRFMHLI